MKTITINIDNEVTITCNDEINRKEFTAVLRSLVSEFGNKPAIKNKVVVKDTRPEKTNKLDNVKI